jgi:hypothetical protein
MCIRKEESNNVLTYRDNGGLIEFAHFECSLRPHYDQSGAEAHVQIYHPIHRSLQTMKRKGGPVPHEADQVVRCCVS